MMAAFVCSAPIPFIELFHVVLHEGIGVVRTSVQNSLRDVQMPKADRDLLLETVLQWYAFRIPTMKEVNSYEILHEVFADN